MGCRISPWGRKILHLPPFSSPLSPYFRIGNVPEVCSSVPNAWGKMPENGTKTCRILHQSYILHLILHPILHPKLPVNTEGLWCWCRKCRRFSKTFFQGEERDVACKGFCNIVNEIVLYLALKLKTKIVSG